MFNIGKKVVPKFQRPVDVFIFTGTFVKGRWVRDPVSTKVQIKASIQETNGRELQFLPEGTRIEELKTLYSNDPLPLDDEQYDPTKYDIRFVILNKTYRLISPKSWFEDFNKYVVKQLRADDNIPSTV